MADVIKAIRTYLLTKTEITSLVGQRIYRKVLPQNATLPAITISRLSTRDNQHLSDRAGLQHSRLSFECYSMLDETSIAIAEAIKTCGVCTLKAVVAEVDIRGVSVEEGGRDWTEASTDGGPDDRYVSAIDLMVDYRG